MKTTVGAPVSVSGTKKKWVAAAQHWTCKHCHQELNAWFEVDHVIPLFMGGNNEVNNLVAMCRECHGKKTLQDNLHQEKRKEEEKRTEKYLSSPLGLNIIVTGVF